MIKSPYRFIVSPINGEQYVNTKQIGEKELIVNTSVEDAENVQRVGLVRSLPSNYKGNIQVGDSVVVQHNVFRLSLDKDGIARQSDNHLKDDLFAVDERSIYLIIRNGEKIATDGYVFIEPIIEDDFWLGKREVDNIGFAKYVNPTMKAQGIKQGTKVAFKNHSTYLFEIFGERLYLMRNSRVVAKLN